MIASTIWNNLVSTLRNNPALSEYIKYVFEGVREIDFEADSLPCLMLEPVSDGEIDRDLNQVQDLWFSVDVYALSSNNIQEYNKTIVGGVDYKGILDINNDIRACLSSSYTLGDSVIDIKIEDTSFDVIPNKYPMRGLRMPIKILYRQTDGA